MFVYISCNKIILLKLIEKLLDPFISHRIWRTGTCFHAFLATKLLQSLNKQLRQVPNYFFGYQFGNTQLSSHHFGPKS